MLIGHARRLPLALFLCNFLNVVYGASTFSAHRMVQFNRAGAKFGSRRTGFNLLAGGPTTADLSQRVLVVRMDELTAKTVGDICSGSLALGGLLIVLPANLTEVSEARLKDWRGFEQTFLKAAIAVPVYFTFRSPATEDIAAGIVEGGDGHHLVVSEAEATPTDPIQSENLQGWLTGSATDDEGEVVPSIAIVTHYDTFGVAPSLAVGADDNGSGVVAFLEIARLFSKLYRQMGTQGRYNVLFVLTGAGRVSFAGAKHWLDKADTRLLQNIELAICIDSIGSGEGLYLHISKPAKDPEIVKLYEEFQATASRMGIPFGLVHKKIDLSDPEVYWQHEQFSRKRVLAATVSRHDEAVPSVQHGSIFDRSVNLTLLKRNTKFLAEVLASHIYGFHGKGLEVFTGTMGVNHDFVAAWQGVLSQRARMQLYLSHATKSSEQGQVVEGLAAELGGLMSNGTMRRESFKAVSLMKFFGTADVQMSAFKVKPLAFECAMTAAISLYLVVLFFVLNGYKDGMAKISSIFAEKSRVKAKSR